MGSVGILQADGWQLNAKEKPWVNNQRCDSSAGTFGASREKAMIVPVGYNKERKTAGW